MMITKRTFNRFDDFNMVREFLIQTNEQTGTFHNWVPSMIENMWRGPCGTTEYQDEEDNYVKVWENDDGAIIAVTISKPSGECRILIHPEYRDFEKTLIEFLEQAQVSMRTSDENPKMYFIVESGDTIRENLLRERGYEDRGVCEHNRILTEYNEIVNITLPEGYKLRHVDIEQDFQKYKEVQTAVFSHCKDMTPNMAKIYSEAEFYTPELDIVAVAPDESFAAFTTGRMDPVSKIAELEPVGVHPEHRRKGLGKAVVLECIKRLKKKGAKTIVILGAASTEEATYLYDSVGFSKTNVHVWVKAVK